MKERPILFSGPMVRALLDGSKTQTRRVVKAKPSDECPAEMWPHALKDIVEWRQQEGRWFGLMGWRSLAYADCPYGQPGDRLYVRETWRGVVEINPPGKTTELGVARYVPGQQYCRRVEYQATQERGGEPWRPSIHMPRWASRITLEVTGVRVERLKDMEGQTAFESDALKEGIHRIHHGDGEYGYHVSRTEPHPNNWVDPCDAFRDLWNSLNAARGFGWDANPWVWVIEFRRVSI